MSIRVDINSVDKSSAVLFQSLSVKQTLSNQADTASFKISRKSSSDYLPEINDDVQIYDGSTKIFGGTVSKISDDVKSPSGLFQATINCVDYTYLMDKRLVSRTYEDKTIAYIIADLLATYAPDFNANNVLSTFEIEKIVFNQVTISKCIAKLAGIVRYDWYVDENKSVHFFTKFSESAPFALTDINGNYVPGSLKRGIDGSQIVSKVKVRGGEYDGALFTDVITVSGNDTTTFKLPYKFANLAVRLDTGGGYVAQDVGVDFIDDFTTKDVLYNYNDRVIRFENALASGNKIEFSGNPKIRVFAAAEDPVSRAEYGLIEKLIRDESIKSNVVARKRAAAELMAYADSVIDVSFYTYESGLRAGQSINIQSTNLGINDDLIIKDLTFKPVDPNTFGYTVGCISSTRVNFLDLLQKILAPDEADDETEVSEEIYLDIQDVNIDEEIEMTIPVEADETVSIDENILKDPLGAGVEPEWVLSSYTPTGQDDTKRPGRLGISTIFY